MLIIEYTVGFMLKVLKNGFDTTPFKNEFNAIRKQNQYLTINLQFQ